MMNKKLKIRIIEQTGTQKEFARIVGEYATTVSGVVRGVTYISYKKKKKWASALKCNIEDIFDMDMSRRIDDAINIATVREINVVHNTYKGIPQDTFID